MWEKEIFVKTLFLPGVVIEVVAGTDCREHRYGAAVVEVQDFVEGAHEVIELVEGPDLCVDQD